MQEEQEKATEESSKLRPTVVELEAGQEEALCLQQRLEERTQQTDKLRDELERQDQRM